MTLFFMEHGGASVEWAGDSMFRASQNGLPVWQMANCFNNSNGNGRLLEQIGQWERSFK
jgi:hypothetical protein